MKILFLYLGIFCLTFFMSSISIGQNYIYNTGQLVFSGSTVLNLQGDFINAESGAITSSGSGNEININGNIINNATSTLDFNNLKVKFLGNTNNSISGTQNIVFNNLEIAKDASTNFVYLQRNVSVANNLTMTQGKIDLRGFNIDLGTTGVLVNETNDNRVYASDGTTAGQGTGVISATRTLVSGDNTNIAGLGINIHSTTYTGSRTISRGHKISAGTGTLAANHSVMRYFSLPDFGYVNANSHVSLKYFDAELNGHVKANLVVFQKILHNSKATTEDWLYLNTTSDAGNNSVSVYDSGATGGFYRIVTTTQDQPTGVFTIASQDVPLPVELISFDVVCNTDSYLLKWKTASEINNDFFTIERSNDGLNFTAIAQISGAGNSNIINEYKHYDNDKKMHTVYFRLVQTDYDGISKTFDINSTTCDNNISNVKIYSPDASKIITDFYSITDCDYSLSILDMLGHQLYSEQGFASAGNNYMEIENLNFKNSLYVVILTTNEFKHVEKIHLSN